MGGRGPTKTGHALDFLSHLPLHQIHQVIDDRVQIEIFWRIDAGDAELFQDVGVFARDNSAHSEGDV